MSTSFSNDDHTFYLVLYLLHKKILLMSYFRESFQYQPIQLFPISNTADIIQSRGDITYNLRRTINLPPDTIGYISLRELTIPNTNYNLSTTNNTLVLVDSHFVQETFTITPSNYTVTETKNTQLQQTPVTMASL